MRIRLIDLGGGRLFPQQLIDHGGRYRWMACEVLSIDDLDANEARDLWVQVEAPSTLVLQAKVAGEL